MIQLVESQLNPLNVLTNRARRDVRWIRHSGGL
jgi:hypothetical protein